MSHFTVIVRLTEARITSAGGNIEDALAEILAPYNEQPEGEDEEKYMKFTDDEPEYRAQWENETIERVRSPSGELFTTYDDRFKVVGERGSLFGSTTKIPDDYTRVQVPFKEIYPTFELFAEEYHGAKKNEKTGTYGHWRNDQAKWDWFCIGGRWSGFFPLKAGRSPQVGRPGVFNNKATPGHGDIVRGGDIDMDFVATEARRRAEEFWTEWTAYLEDPDKNEGQPFDGPRHTALNIGILDVVRGPAESTEKLKAIPWNRPGSKWKMEPTDARRTWTDVAKLLTHEEFLRDFLSSFNPIASYAALDDDGWHAPGEMGWFGCDNAEADAKVKFHKEFMARFIHTKAPYEEPSALEEGPVPPSPTDTLVVVDCHI